jgi:hypothetical protein
MRLIAAVLLSTVLILSSAGCKDRARKQAAKSAFNEIGESGQNVRKSIKEGMTEDGLVIDYEVLEEQQRTMEKAGEKLGGKEGESLKIFAAIQGESNAYAKKIEQRSAEMIASLDWETLASTGDYETRRKTLRDHAAFNLEVIAYFDSRPAELGRRLDAIKFTGKDRTDLERGFTSSFGKMLPLIREIRQCDITACEIGVRTIDLLEKEKGKWRWNAANEAVDFENDAAYETFAVEMARLIEAGQRQLELQQQMIKGL